jgi:hypothetical protein
MRNTIKKKITKGILLFLFTFFSVGVQGQWDENELRHWSATAVGQMIVNALNTSDSWQSTESFFVRDQEGNFVRIDFSLEEVVVTKGNGSGNFKFKDDEEPLFDELVVLEELTPEELAEAKETVQVIPNCPKWYVWDGAQCVLVPEAVRRPCEKAGIADHVYYVENGNSTSALPARTTLVPKSSLPKNPDGTPLKLTDNDTGFNSALYRVDNGNGKIEYVYSTQGSDFKNYMNDWKNNLQQGTGFISEQYTQSIANAKALQKWAEDNHYTLSFTGHSLGGGMANANALATGLKATIYNPAGLSDATINNVDYQLNLGNSKNVTAYVVHGEPVSFVNDVSKSPVRGTTNYIGSYAIPLLGYGSSIALGPTGAGGATALIATAGYLHSMGTVIANLDCN